MQKSVVTEPARTEERLRQGLEGCAQAYCKLVESVPMGTHRVVVPAHSSDPALDGIIIGKEAAGIDQRDAFSKPFP